MAHGPLAYSLWPMVHWPIVYTFPTAWSKAHGTASVLCASLMVVTNTNVCTHVCTHVYLHVYTHVCIHAYANL